MPKAAAPRTSKRRKTETASKAHALFGLEPLSCRHYPDHSDIEAYVMASGDRQPVAEIKASAYFSAEAAAEFFAKAVNDYARHKSLIAELVAALESCLECKGLDWSAEHDGELALRRARQEA